jgi:hypothetical protein
MSYHDVTGDHPQLEEFAKGEWVQYAQQLMSKAGFDPVDPKNDNAFASVWTDFSDEYQSGS